MRSFLITILIIAFSGATLAQPITNNDTPDNKNLTSEQALPSTKAGPAKLYVALAIFGALGSRVQNDKSLPVYFGPISSTFSANFLFALPIGQNLEIFLSSGYAGLTHTGDVNLTSIRSLAGLNYFVSPTVALFAAGVVDYELTGNIKPERSLGDAQKTLALEKSEFRRPAGGVMAGAKVYFLSNHNNRISMAFYGHYQTTALKLDFLGLGTNVQVDFLF